MPHLRARIRIDALNRQPHDTPRDHNLSSRKATRVKDQRARRLFAQAASKGLRRKLRQKRVLVPQDLAGSADRLAHARVALRHHWHNAMAHIVAQVRYVLVALVLSPRLTMYLQIAHQLVMSQIEQRPHHDIPPAGNAR